MRLACLAPLCAIALMGCQTVKDPYAAGRELNGPPLVVDPAIAARIDAHPADAGPRRELAYTLIADSDAQCEDYLVAVSSGRNTYAAGFSVASLALSTIGGITSPVRSANILSAGSTLAQGTSQTISDTVFGGRDYAVLYAAIKAGRKERRDQIFADIRQGAFDDWSASSIRAVLTPYHLDCGLNYGLQLLGSAVREKAQESDKKEDERQKAESETTTKAAPGKAAPAEPAAPAPPSPRSAPS